MKKTLTFIMLVLLMHSLSAQLASREPEPRKAVVESFTGVRCANCPTGHNIVETIRDQYPNDIWSISYHPTNSNLTTPLNPGDLDLSNSFANAFYAPNFTLRGQLMPSAFVNRRIWDGARMAFYTEWSAHAQSILQESSPVNIGLAAFYDTIAREVHLDVEVFFTKSTNDQALYVMLLEDDLLASQSGPGGGVNYLHDHVFRAALTHAQWGDPLSVSADSGNVYGRQFSYNNRAERFDWEKLTVVAFLRDVNTEEISTGAGLDKIETSNVSTGIEAFDMSSMIELFPNPVFSQSTVKFTLLEASPVVVTLYNTVGIEVAKYDFGLRSAGTQKLTFDIDKLPQGVYSLRIDATNASGVKSLIKY